MKIDIYTLLSGFIDIYQLPTYIKEKPQLGSFIYHTLKYKFAEKGLCFTGNEQKLAKFKNIHRGKRCFIIGNGPSLNKCNLRYLKSEKTFGVNSIFLNYETMGFYPTYYVVEDILVAEDRASQINSYNKSQKFFGNYLNYCIADSEETIWLNVLMRYEDYPDFPNFSKNALRKLWAGGTVTYLCMQLAYYMGFNEVYLVGFDHSYKIPSDVRIEGNVIQSASEDPNHFDNSYFGKGYRWHDPRVDRMEIAYNKAKYYFEKDGRKIYNATVEGHLEVFERVNYNNLFHQKN